jgi:type II secretory pathway component PulF
MRVGRGQSLEEATSEEPLLTEQYRQALLTYLRCDDPRIALDSLSSPATTRRRLALGLGSAMVYPLILLTIAYCGFLYLCQVTGPAIETMYRQSNQSPSWAISFLAIARQWVPVWAPLVPLLIAIGLLWWKLRGSNLSWSWLPGTKRYYQSVHHSHVANQLAGMLESGCSLEQSLETVLPTAKRGDAMPPLLRWAIEGEGGDEPLPKVLRFVATIYQQTAERQERTWRLMTPMICGLAFGGLLVLAYGLSLFLPVVQLLRDIALPGSGVGGI